MGIASISIVMTVVVLNFHYCSPINKHELPDWIKSLIINDDKNNKYNQWKFFATCFIFTQFIGFFVLHLLCSMYTIKIHKCSTKLIYCRIHFPLQPLSLRIRTSLYIEKIHTENRYGFILARATLISMFFFIQVCKIQYDNHS